MKQKTKMLLSSLAIVLGSVFLLAPVAAVVKPSPKLPNKKAPALAAQPAARTKKTTSKKRALVTSNPAIRGFQAWNKSLKKNVSPKFQKFRDQKELEEEARERALLAKARQGEKVATVIDDNAASSTSSQSD